MSATVKLVERLWVENTRENPFYRESRPVEVKMKNGKQYTFTCPHCAMYSFDLVTHWRLA